MTTNNTPEPVTLDMIKRLRVDGDIHAASQLLQQWKDHNVRMRKQERKELIQKDYQIKKMLGLCTGSGCRNPTNGKTVWCDRHHRIHRQSQKKKAKEHCDE